MQSDTEAYPLLSSRLKEELSAILLIQAHQIEMCSGKEAAVAFIGFSHCRNGSFCALDPKRDDLRRFPISYVFADAEAYVNNPCPQNFVGESVTSLKHFVKNLPYFSAYHELGGTLYNVADFYSHCRDVVDTAYARWNLEVNRRGPFTARELSLLSGIEVQEVRRMLKDRTGGMTGEPRSKNAKVGFEEAKRWLFIQENFKSSWPALGDDPCVRDALSGVRTSEELGSFIRRHRSMFARITEPALKLFASGELLALERGELVYDTARAADIAKRLDLDVPLFVGKVVEVTMRQREMKR